MFKVNPDGTGFTTLVSFDTATQGSLSIRRTRAGFGRGVLWNRDLKAARSAVASCSGLAGGIRRPRRWHPVRWLLAAANVGGSTLRADGDCHEHGQWDGQRHGRDRLRGLPDHERMHIRPWCGCELRDPGCLHADRRWPTNGDAHRVHGRRWAVRCQSHRHRDGSGGDVGAVEPRLRLGQRRRDKWSADRDAPEHRVGAADDRRDRHHRRLRANDDMPAGARHSGRGWLVLDAGDVHADGCRCSSRDAYLYGRRSRESTVGQSVRHGVVPTPSRRRSH